MDLFVAAVFGAFVGVLLENRFQILSFIRRRLK